ncbi:hypothetical protein [Hathewaya limosa]|uniref:Peptidase MA superfamily n=1 Tax=Hathewaya limosa TaxID=1536 RepID=A0ABU0JS13_HATLI|nr:hypothetical protein [Hathewaya limosa]MDQ0479881.1 hypothetical protein [Hathewaya limosa]
MSFIKTKSKNYVFNYEENSLAHRNIEKIIELQENCFNTINYMLNVTMSKKINYFLCDSPKKVGEVCGDNEPCNGFARYPNIVYAVYNEEVKCLGFHEDTHLIAYNTLGNPPQVFIREGLAMYFDKVYLGISNYAWTKYFLENNLYVGLKDLLENEKFYKCDCNISYPIAGAFTEYIMGILGVDKYKKFYSELNKEVYKKIETTFGSDLLKLEEGFKKYISCIGMNKEVYKIISHYNF